MKYLNRQLTAAACLCILSASATSAATIGTITFDDNAWADTATVAHLPNGGAAPINLPNTVNGNTASGGVLGSAIVEFSFTDNILLNGAGYDLAIFAYSNNNRIALDKDADPNTSPFYAGDSVFVPNDPNQGNNSGDGIIAYLFDLSALGFGAGAELSNGIFLQKAGLFSTVYGVAALNSKNATTAVPLPAGLPLLLGGIAGVSIASKIRKRRRT